MDSLLLLSIALIVLSSLQISGGVRALQQAQYQEELLAELRRHREATEKQTEILLRILERLDADLHPA